MLRWLLRSLLLLATMLLTGLCSDQSGPFGPAQLRVYFTEVPNGEMKWQRNGNVQGILGEVDAHLRFRRTAVLPDFGAAVWTPDGDIFIAPRDSDYVAQYRSDGALVKKLWLPRQSKRIRKAASHLVDNQSVDNNAYSLQFIPGEEALLFTTDAFPRHYLNHWNLTSDVLTTRAFKGGSYVYEAESNRLWVAGEQDTTYDFQGIGVVFVDVRTFGHYVWHTSVRFRDINADGQILYTYAHQEPLSAGARRFEGIGIYANGTAEIMYQHEPRSSLMSAFFGLDGFVMIRDDPMWSMAKDFWWLDPEGLHFFWITQDRFNWKEDLAVLRIGEGS